MADPIVTVADIDEAIWWVLLTAPRQLDYRRLIDSLLDQRNRISSGLPLLDCTPPPLPPLAYDAHTRRQ